MVSLFHPFVSLLKFTNPVFGTTFAYSYIDFTVELMGKFHRAEEQHFRRHQLIRIPSTSNFSLVNQLIFK